MSATFCCCIARTNASDAISAVANKQHFIDSICITPINIVINLEEDNYGKFSRYYYTLIPEL